MLRVMAPLLSSVILLFAALPAQAADLPYPTSCPNIDTTIDTTARETMANALACLIIGYRDWLRSSGKDRHAISPKLHKQLMVAAQSHSDWMAKTGIFSHEGANGSSMFDRAEAAGYVSNGMGEILAISDTPRGAMLAWLASPGHKEILSMSDPDHIFWPDFGIGITQWPKDPQWSYYTVNFGFIPPNQIEPVPDGELKVSLGKKRFRGKPLKSYLAPAGYCEGEKYWENTTQIAQQNAFTCLINYARRKADLSALRPSGMLMDASYRLARDMSGLSGGSCSVFSPDPLKQYRRAPNFCGRSIYYRLNQSNYGSPNCNSVLTGYYAGMLWPFRGSPRAIYTPRTYMKYLLRWSRQRNKLFMRRSADLGIGAVTRFSDSSSESKYWALYIARNSC